MEKVLIEIQKLGFSQYESKVYVALLQNSSVTGYELSKRSGVPRSMVYEVINKLIERGAIYVIPSEPIKYCPVPAKELLKRLRRNVDESFEFLERSLDSLEYVSDVEVISHISGNENVINEIISIIDDSKQELWLSVWEPHSLLIEGNVKKAVDRNVKVLSIVFGSLCELGVTFHHDYMTPEVVKARIGGKLTVVVRDQEEVVIANILENSVAWAVKTRDPALVLVATEFIRHDIMIEAITRYFGPEQLDKLWHNHLDLNYVVTGMRSN
jgi:HTH-type transcriptional regulator, sugar sensing transcriptional regulator